MGVEIKTKEELFKSLDLVKNKLSELNDSLLADNLNVNSLINTIISMMTNIRGSKKKIELESEENTRFENEFRGFRDELKRLKSLHISFYNKKIKELKNRFSKFERYLFGNKYSDEVKKEIGAMKPFVEKLQECDFWRKNGEWKNNTYLVDLDYDNITALDGMLKGLETKLNVKDDVSIDVNAMLIVVESELNGLKSIDNLTPQQVADYLDKCSVLFGRLASSNIAHEKLRGKISEEEFSKLSQRIVTLQGKLSDTKTKLVEKRQSDNVYKNLFDSIELLEREYTELFESYSSDEKKCTEKMVVAYRRLLRKLDERFEDINREIAETFSQNRINDQQQVNLIVRSAEIVDIKREFHEKLDSEPGLSNSDDMFLGIEDEFEELGIAIQNMGSRPLKDRKARSDVGKSVAALDKRLIAIETVITRMKGYNEEKYNVLKTKYDEYKKKYDELNQQYNSKCPLIVRKVREAKPIYQKHKKLGLISAGLASISLVTSNFTIIPAIMHGNQMLGSVVPAFINKILGSMIGATKKGASWILATGVTLSSTVATTAILKSIATIGVGAAALAAPLYIPQIVNKVKGLTEKIKAFNLKRKLTDAKNVGVKKFEELKQNISDRRDEHILNKYYENMYDAFLSYNADGMTVPEFCKKYDISNEDKKVLLLYITRGNLDKKINTATSARTRRSTAGAE